MNNHPTFVFFGTPDVSSETLEILKSHGLVPQLVVTAPDRPVGRHFVMTPPPAKAWAAANDVPFIQPEKITPEIIASLPASDLFIVVAYGKILPRALIDTPRRATLNIHYSLLPRWRGASPVEAAILAGDAETGVSIQKMVFKLDAGPVIAESRIPIEPDDTTPSLRGKLIPLGAELLVSVLEKDSYDGIEQDESRQTHCGKTRKEDGLIDPDNDDALAAYRKYRAYQPWPGLHYFRDGKRVKVTKARLEKGKFVLEKIVPEGQKEIDLA